jgi:hypothetical protein
VTRRGRRRRPARPLAAAAAVLAIVIVIVHPAVLAWAAIVAAAVLGWRYRHMFRRPPGHRAAPARPRAPAVRSGRDDARARRNGWAPPARGQLVTVRVSPECAGDACAMCPGGDCGCVCGHNPRVIGAMNTARADTGPPPF